MRGDLNAAWDVIEDIRKENTLRDRQLTELKMESEACKIARLALDSDLVEMCNTLKDTKREVLDEAKESRKETNERFDLLSKEIKELVKEKARSDGVQEGMIKVAERLPTVFWVLLSAGITAGLIFATMGKP